MEIFAPPTTPLSFSKPSPFLSNLPPSFISYRTKPQPPKSITFAKSNRRRSGTRKSNRILLQSAAFLAANLKVLPEPLEYFVRDLAGGNGGRFGFRNGFGFGGSDGRGRKGEKWLGFWVFVVVSGFLCCFVAVDRGIGRDSSWIVPILGALGLFCLGSAWKREIRGWLLGFCCGASLVGVGLQSGNLVNWSQKFTASNRYINPIEAILGKTRRRRRC